MNTEKICALIRQTWYETARKNLQPEERLRFYETCFEYEFNNTAPADDLPFAARLLFDMVQNDIDSDRQRVQERRERNAQNGKKGGRPKVTASNEELENPKKPSGFSANPIYTTIHNNTQQNTTKNSVSNETEDRHTFFACCLDFFARGCSNAVAEGQTFWNYYAALGWKTKSGADIVDRLALARAWRLSELSPALTKKRLPWVDLLRIAAPFETCFLTEFVDMTKDATARKITVTLETQGSAMLFENKYIPKISIEKWQLFLRRFGCEGDDWTLEYRCIQPTIK